MFLVGDVLIDYSHQPGRSGGDSKGSPLISPDNNTACKEPYKVTVIRVLDDACKIFDVMVINPISNQN